MKDFRNYSLLHHNTFGIDAKCRRFVEFSSIEELQDVLHSLTDSDRPLLLLGGGSNLLLTGDYHGTVLHSAIMGHEATDQGDNVTLRCGSGETWDNIVALCVSMGWHGIENLSLIPGEVGASAVQNIGAYGTEVKDVIVLVEAVEIETGQAAEFTNEQCEYGYRQSKFKGEWREKYIITYVTYRLSKTFNPHLDYGNIRSHLNKQGIINPTPQQLRDTIIRIRREKLPDPAIEGNAGSFFMNPIVDRDKFNEITKNYPEMPHYTVDAQHEKIPASWMIEMCGWKGHTLGAAGVHDKQALVLVNRGKAAGEDIVKLCRKIQEDVYKRFGVRILPEVNIK